MFDSGAPSQGADPSELLRLGELEARVIDVLWDQAAWLSPREVREILAAERQLAYTTVMTILVRLWRKGLLERRKDGRSYVYHTVHSREEWTARRMTDVLEVAGNRSEALSHFVSGMESADLDQLRRLLRIEGK